MSQESSTPSIVQPRLKAPARRANRPEKRPLVYLASPMPTYQTARYDTMIEHARRAFPGAELLPARGLYHSSEHWLATWPEHLRRITTAVFFTDVDRSIGLGVYHEVQDVLAAGMPVHLLQDSGKLIPFERVRLSLIDGGASWRCYARVTVRPERKKASR